jgi:hypothetical protein
VPAHFLLGELEDVVFFQVGVPLGDSIEDAVVELEERGLQLGDDQILVVARVADERTFVRVPLQVGPVDPLVPGGDFFAGLKVDAVFFVEVRLVGRAPAVEGIEVEARGAEVLEPVGVVLAGEAGDRVEGDVVVDELPKVGVAGGKPQLAVLEFGRVLIVVLYAERLVELPILELLDHFPTEVFQRADLWRVDRQMAEHPPEPSAGYR